MLKQFLPPMHLLFRSRSKPETLFDLITEERWEIVRNHLATEGGKSEVFQSGTNNESWNGYTALHASCLFYPPLDIISLLVEIYPAALSQEDASGRTPLHIAASMCVPLEVIKFLVEKCAAPLATVDHEGKTPLILLLETSTLQTEFYLYERGIYNFWEYVMTATVFLCDAAPKTVVNIEDSKGKCALEYAITNDATVDVVCFLMRRSKAGHISELKVKEK